MRYQGYCFEELADGEVGRQWDCVDIRLVREHAINDARLYCHIHQGEKTPGSKLLPGVSHLSEDRVKEVTSFRLLSLEDDGDCGCVSR